ncbi:MAG: adenylyl-sulfate kinase [Proteobacteria bacterium]|nr:adenylyl-sulfate kinase [Pseudomonadota bacterium]MDA1022754.1 adenylyl-sulfate kinase [Pseudomonadota bacterium]
MSIKSQNIVEIEHRVSDQDRWQRQGHKGGVLWMTGLPGSGKSTLAFELERSLFAKGRQVFVMDGDNLRHGLNSDLGFSPQDRAENIRRVGEVAGLYASAGMITVTAFISPYQAARDAARAAAKDRFHEVYLSASLDVCEGRDPKGHYKKARSGEIPDFTGVSAPYESPEAPELVVNTGVLSVEESLALLEDYVAKAFALEAE